MNINFDRVDAGYSLPNGDYRSVFEGLNLTINRGEMVYLVGPTGSGKTTLLRMLYMDVKPVSGTLRVGKYESDTIKPEEIPLLRRQLGVVFQDFQLLPDRNVYENVAFALHVTGKQGIIVRSRTLQALTRVGLTHKQRRMPHELSGGEQQRVVLARAMVNEPWILLADEPTGNLDPSVADEIMNLIVGLHRQGMTVLMATHDYRLVRKFPARVIKVSGNLVEETSAEALEQ